MKSAITQNFNLVASNYDNPAQRYFPMTGDRIISLLKPCKGSKILDVACGTGAVSIAAAQAIYPTGQVHAVDLANKMLDMARTKCRQLGLDNIELHTMDAEMLDFDDNYFDAVTCSFGIFFLDEMMTGLKEWLRVIKPGGRLLFTSFTESAFGEPIQQFKNDIKEYGVELNPAKVEAVSTAEGCIELLNQAGFVATQSSVAQMGYHLASEQDWWEIVMSSGLRGYVEQLVPSQRADFELRHKANIARLRTHEGIWLDVKVLFSQGHKPAE